jgi:hypothetical protein
VAGDSVLVVVYVKFEWLTPSDPEEVMEFCSDVVRVNPSVALVIDHVLDIVLSGVPLGVRPLKDGDGVTLGVSELVSLLRCCVTDTVEVELGVDETVVSIESDCVPDCERVRVGGGTWVPVRRESVSEIVKVVVPLAA